MQPSVVLAIAAHPDDIDFTSGGTLAMFAAQGAEVHYLQLTDGCKGTHDTSLSPKEVAAIRRKEQQEACRLLGGKSVTFLNHCDGELSATTELKLEIVRVIRTIKPDVVITTDPTLVYYAEMGMINHSDHRVAGQAALDAIYPMARDHLTSSELIKQGLLPHKVKTVLLINFEKHNYTVDISEYLDKKMAAVRAHESQLANADEFIHMLTSMAEHAGQDAEYAYGERFVRIDIEP